VQPDPDPSFFLEERDFAVISVERLGRGGMYQYICQEGNMIITRQKSFEEIVEALSGDTKIFLAGCTECATVCKTGGEPELKQMKEKLENAGKQVTGVVILEPACNLVEAKKAYQKNKEAVTSSDSILAMSCGNGTRTALEGFKKPVRVANDTLFLGQVSRAGYFQENCSMCGECILNETGGICPLTFCPKGLLNGPCGGYSDGKCEVNRENDCAWVMIYEKAKEQNRIDKIKPARAAKDWSKVTKPKKREIEGVAVRL
jgi:ferredoxin